jgi:glycosyltransferase involved in cell wall biosynthesis
MDETHGWLGERSPHSGVSKELRSLLSLRSCVDYMKILMTANTAWNIWNFRRPLVNSFLSDGGSVTVLAPPDDSVHELERLGCRFLPLEMSAKGLNPLEDLKLLRSLKRHFRSEQPDVVLSYTIKNNIFGAMAAQSYRIPFLPNVSGLGTAFLSGGVLRMVSEMLYRRAFAPLPAIIFQNPDDRDLFLRRNIVRSEQAQIVSGSGIDLTRFSVTELPPDDGAPVFLLIARLLRDKGVIEFVDAARQLKTRRPKVRLQLLGATGSENRTAIDAAMVQNWVSEGIVEYLGTTSDVRPFIAAAHGIVLPSYREGAPRTLIEGAAMGRPLVATNVPGCRAVVEDEVTGFLCDARNAQKLAEALERFADLTRNEKIEMGLAGRTKMEREFDQTIVVNAYRQAIADLIGTA